MESGSGEANRPSVLAAPAAQSGPAAPASQRSIKQARAEVTIPFGLSLVYDTTTFLVLPYTTQSLLCEKVCGRIALVALVALAGPVVLAGRYRLGQVRLPGNSAAGSWGILRCGR